MTNPKNWHLNLPWLASAFLDCIKPKWCRYRYLYPGVSSNTCCMLCEIVQLLILHAFGVAGLVTIQRRLLSTQMRMIKSRYAVMGPMDHCHLTTVDTDRVSCCFRLYMLSIHLLQNEINELIPHLLPTVTVVFVAGGIGMWLCSSRILIMMRSGCIARVNYL